MKEDGINAAAHALSEPSQAEPSRAERSRGECGPSLGPGVSGPQYLRNCQSTFLYAYLC